MENNKGAKSEKHICKQDGCCKDCCECSCHHRMRGYYIRHFLILVLGVMFAFWCGFKLGVIKGFILSNYNQQGMHMYHHYDYRMKPMMHEEVPVSAVPATSGTEAIQ